MYSSPYASALEFRPRSSRALAAWLLAGHALAAACLAAAGAGATPVLLVLACLPLSLRRAIAPLGRGVERLTWSPRAGWAREDARGQYFPMELQPGSVVTNAALFLHWRDEEGAWRVLLPADSLDGEAWRRMRVLARFHDAGRTHC